MRRWLCALLARHPLYTTAVLIRDGRAIRVRGQVRPSQLSGLSDLAGDLGLADGCILATVTQRDFRLSLYCIPAEYHQRVRNVWAANR